MIKRETKEEFFSSDEYRVEVKFLIYNTREYEKGIALSLKWLDKISDGLETNSINDLWAAYYYIGIGYWGLNKFKNAIGYLNDSLKYAVHSDILNTMTMLGLCYLGLGNKELALEMYKKSLKSCEEMKDIISEIRYLNTKASLLHNIGEILEQDEYYYESIFLYKELIRVGFSEVQETLNKIDNNYKYLIRLYIAKNNIFKANSLLNNISSYELRQTLKEEIRNKMFGELKVANIL